MNIRQISVFVENKNGRLSAIIKILKDNNIDLRALSVADTRDFGIVRFIVNDPDKACEVLRENNCTVTVTKVVAIEIADEPGSLSEILEVLKDNGVNIEYMYAFLSKTDNMASIIFRVDDNAKASEAFQSAGVRQLAEKDICGL